MQNKIKVALVSSEVSPLAKVGGLADVVGSLPKSFDQKKIDARIFAPAYEQINLKVLMAKTVLKSQIALGGTTYNFEILLTELPNSKIPLYLVKERSLLSQGPIYEHGATLEEKQNTKFLLFCQAVLSSFEKIEWIPDIIHTHDWPTAPIALLRSVDKTNKTLAHSKTLVTIHNINHQNYVSIKLLEKFGVSETLLSEKSKSHTNKNYLNLFAQSLISADAVNTVSPSYAKEILTPEFGTGLQDILKSRPNKTVGILNGIDVNYYNPQTDQSVFFRYSEKNLDEKTFNKTDLQKMLGLEISSEIMLAGMVTRIDRQKGIELVISAVEKLAEKKIQFVILGTGEKNLSEKLVMLEKEYRNNFVFLNRYDHPLARKIYAGSDIFLMPSRFEPCGLTQLIAMRYGTIPVVRSTGGLKDTVIDHEQKDGYGFVFEDFSNEALIRAVEASHKLYKLKNLWKKLQLRAMKLDFSWKKSAKDYEKLYMELLTK